MEGLRGIAAVSVLAAHSVIYLRAGTGTNPVRELGSMGLHGVTLFFVLSGFLLYLPFARAIVERRPRPRARAFWRNRFLRIGPAYLVIFLVACVLLPGATTSAISGQTLLHPHAAQIGRLTDPALVLANLLLVQGYFPSGMLTGLNTSWSLVPEVAFYAVLPGLALAGMALARRWRRPVVAAAAVPACLVLVGEAVRVSLVLHFRGTASGHRVIGLIGDSWTAVLYRSIAVNIDLFALGMLAAVLLVTLGRRDPAAARRVCQAGLATGLVILLPSFLVDGEFAIGLIAASLVARITLAGESSHVASQLLNSSPMVYLGRISYSIYLWHYPIVMLLMVHGWFLAGGSAASLANVALVLVITVALSDVSYRLIEAPALRRKVRAQA